MKKEELKKILKQFEYETSCERMWIDEFHNTYVVCVYEQLVYTRNPRDPGDVDMDVDVVSEKVSLIDIAKAIDKMPSWYWHTVAEDIRAYYYAYIDWKTFSTSKEYLDFMCEHFMDFKCDEAIEISKSIFYAYQQLYKVQQDIKDIDADLDKGNLEEDEIRQLCNALNQLLGDEDNLKWEIDVLLNKVQL